MKEALFFLLLGNHCPFCGKPIARERTICPACAERVRVFEPQPCPQCGASPCRCRENGAPLSGVAARFDYAHGAKAAVLALKSGSRPGSAYSMALWIEKWIAEAGWTADFDFLLPVPSPPRWFHPRRHALLLTGQLSRLLGVPYRRGLLCRRRSKKQHSLATSEQRAENLKGKLYLSHPEDVIGKTILLIDDVITTGSTLRECAKLLRLHGAKAVYAAAFCRAKESFFEAEEQAAPSP